MFYPGNPGKYAGDVNNVIFRSGLELRLFKYLDTHPQVIQWSSEEFVVMYYSPVDKKMHRYFLDAKITTRDKTGTEKTYLIEVKPSYQCIAPKAPKKPNKKNQARFLREAKTWAVNTAKWQAAEAICEKKGWSFLKITEKTLTY